MNSVRKLITFRCNDEFFLVVTRTNTKLLIDFIRQIDLVYKIQGVYIKKKKENKEGSHTANTVNIVGTQRTYSRGGRLDKPVLWLTPSKIY